MKAAGILFVCGDKALFLKRSATAPDCAGCWGFPGGGQEGDETAIETAEREAIEEIGPLPPGTPVFHTRQKTGSAPGNGAAGIGAPPVLPVQDGAPVAPIMPPDVDFTTFIQKVDEEFTPVINDEHDGWAWAPLASPPEPLHPGCRIALDRIGMDELAVARAIADGRLTSPQRYLNMALFAIRITGTDVAYRRAHDEFVYRNPENYLTDDFLARCNGLSVIFVRRSERDSTYHPKGALLNSEEYAERIVGTIFLPYIAGDEVWGVAKIFDDAAAAEMEQKQLSTSPSVFFQSLDTNKKLALEDGSTLLIEGKPSLLDHVAICEQGVWDKGGEPSGIRSESRGDSAMTEEETKAAEAKAKKDADEAAEKAKKDADDKAAADKAKADADAGTTLDKTLKGIADSLEGMHKRMDAIEDIEKKRADAAKKDDDDKADPEKIAADKAKKDADDKDKEDKAKADAEAKAKADSEEIRKRIDAVEKIVPKAVSDADWATMADAQARADDVFTKFGKQAPRPLNGETPLMYERRVVRSLKEHSPTWKGVDTAGQAFADDAAFGVIRDQVYGEATIAAMSPSNVPAGELRPIKRSEGGHTYIEYRGEPRTWMDPMAGATRQFVTSINASKPN